jgi:cation diffusion facilitator family transporter
MPLNRARRIATMGIVVSTCLAVLKLTVGWLSHSAALSADGFESAADVLASSLVLIGLTLAARPADDNHPYGHGRVEILTGQLLGFLLLGAGAAIAWRGLTGASDAQSAPHGYAIWPLVISLGVKAALVVIKYRNGRSLGSTSLLADATNDTIDMLSGLVALASLGLTLHDPARFARADYYGAFLVGLIVIATAIRILYDASMHLMDTMPDEDFMQQIRCLAMEVEKVAGVEKCFARKTGLHYHVDLHLEVDPEMTVRESHDVATDVRMHIRRRMPLVADVLVHVEPAAILPAATKPAF